MLGLPGAPALDGVVDATGDGVGRARDRALPLGRRPVQREAHALALGHGEVARMVESSMEAGTPAETAIWLGPPNVRPPPSSMRKSGAHEPVLGPRRELHRHLDAARDALHQAQHLVRRVAPQVVAALTVGEGHRVDQAHAAGGRGEGRLDDERAGQVAALGGGLVPRRDRPVAGVGVEDPREEGGRVVVGHAQPVDRTVEVDQRGRRAVGQQAIGGDRLEAGGAALGGGGGGLGKRAHGVQVPPRHVELRA